MADPIPTQPEQPAQVPPDKAEPKADAQAASPQESEPGFSREMAPPSPSWDALNKSLQDSPAEPPAETPEPPENMPQAPEGELESQENFPCPFDEDIEIVEPPETEESDDGFASILPGPTEEVNFEPPRVRGPRRRRERGRREPAPAAAPAQAGAPEPQPTAKRFPIWLAIAGAVLVAAIIFVVIWLATHRG